MEPQDHEKFEDDFNNALKSISSELTENMEVLDTRAWKRIQVVTFCLGTKNLTNAISFFAPVEKWLEIHIGNLDALRTPSEDDNDKMIVAQHALGNMATGFLYDTIRHYLRGYTAPNSFPKVFHPPRLHLLQLKSSMQLPLPFAADSLDHFSRCHLPIMTDPTFFLTSEWTGYECCPNATGTTRVILVGVMPSEEDHVGDVFSGTLRFSLAEEYSADSYRVDSDKFFMNPIQEVCKLSIQVEKSTGQLRITYQPGERDTWTIDGVMTPFGVVGRAEEGRCWMWLWKTEWSE